LLRDGNALYVGGEFPSFVYSGIPQQIPGIVKWNISPQRWELLSRSNYNDENGSPTSIAKFGDSIYISTFQILQQYVTQAGQWYWRTAASTDSFSFDEVSRVLGVSEGQLLLGGEFTAWTVNGNRPQAVPSTGLVGFVGDEIFAAGFE
jgi:hypothetical protein